MKSQRTKKCQWDKFGGGETISLISETISNYTVTNVVTYDWFLPGDDSQVFKDCKQVAFHPIPFLLRFFLDGGAAGEAGRPFPSPAHSPPVPKNTHKACN